MKASIDNHKSNNEDKQATTCSCSQCNCHKTGSCGCNNTKDIRKIVWAKNCQNIK